MRRLKWVMLALYLILIGLSLLGIFSLDTVAGVLALIAGVMFLIWY